MHYFLKWVESSAKTDNVQGGNGGRDWVDRHIHAAINVGAPFLGLPKAISTIVSGEMRDTAQMGVLESFLLEMLLSKRERLSLFRSWAGGFAMLPKGGNLFWGNGTEGSHVDGEASYSYGLLNIAPEEAAKNGMKPKYCVDEVWKLLDKFVSPVVMERVRKLYSVGIATPQTVLANDDNPSTWTNPLEARLPHAPNMTMYCFYGIGQDTEKGYEYEYVPKEEWPETLRALEEEQVEENSRTDDLERLILRVRLNLTLVDSTKRLHKGIYHVDGDGSVPTLSNGYMCTYGWKRLTHLNPAGIRAVTREYAHEPSNIVADLRGGPKTSNHVDILGNHEMTADILRIVSDFTDPPVSDRILSNIEQMAERIHLPFM